MNQGKGYQLQDAQHKDEILATNEFDYPFPKYHILLKEGTIILSKDSVW
jgi:hypothetical protein